MEPVNNNKFEIIPSAKTKRKITTPCPNAYLNPALDLLANEDPMCNNAMEIVPVKKRKQIKTQDIATFENTALDLGISRAAVSEFLARELENVCKNVHAPNISTRDVKVDSSDENVEDTSLGLRRCFQETSVSDNDENDPIYMNVNDPLLQKDIDDMNAVALEESPLSIETSDDSIKINDIDISRTIEDTTNVTNEEKALAIGNVASTFDTGDISNINHTSANVTNNIFINNHTNLSLSFINRLALDSPSVSNQSLYLDDDLNESNIMEIKTITIITTKKRQVENKNSTNPFLNQSVEEAASVVDVSNENPFLSLNDVNTEMEYTAIGTHQMDTQLHHGEVSIMPRRLFSGANTNSTVSTVNESFDSNGGYENIDSYRSESPIYENVCEDSDVTDSTNKQSKILGYDVTKLSATDIMNINKNSQTNSSVDSNESSKNLKHLLRASNRLSKKVFKTLKKTFRSEKPERNATLNPYEVPRKLPKKPVVVKEAGIENPCLNLDNSDEIEIEELEDEEHQYETIKTRRNTQLNMNVTPLKERNVETDISQNKTHTPGKKVRFDSTLNQEKVITGNSFDYGLQSPGFDAKIDKYQDELENCINERKFIQQIL